MTTRDMLNGISSWLEGHWRITMCALLSVIAIQQFAIWGLQHQLTQHEEMVMSGQTDPGTTGTTEAMSEQHQNEPSGIDIKEVEHTEGQEPHSNTPFLVVILLMGVMVWGYWHMKRNAIFPVGLFVWGRVKRSATGITYNITVRNWSTKSIEVSQPMINFMMVTGVRKFRATVPDLPITLQPGTKYETTINLTGLISRNVELCEARGIGMSIMVDDRKHTTLPWPVKIQATQSNY